jgi:hypothetical protein
MDHCIDFLQEQNDDCIIQEKRNGEIIVDVVDVIGVIDVGFDVRKNRYKRKSWGVKKRPKKRIRISVLLKGLKEV